MKCLRRQVGKVADRRAPHGARGLKSVQRLPGSSPTPPKTADAPDCICSPGRPISKEGMLCRKDKSEARSRRRATEEEVP